ncbi:DUF885 domain-containing protein [Glacieibacterium frigidum]|uniref:DUF885 family protein n=1 Tax=Glacieibacterium frigidum TaxID=2593303 RepID=A0A552U911_9SPHN|nr:DUF885 family protein [Glacieibacterium frigidum]TRW14716.1 DUF885 family protein [Glacieibacterium frigidum]
MFTRFAFAAVAFALFAGAPAHADPATDARFKAIYTREWAWRLQQAEADEDDNGSKVRPRLPSLTPASQAARLAYWEKVRAELDALPPAQLSPATQVDYGIYRAQIDQSIDEQRFRDWEKPLNSDTSFWSNLAGLGEARGFRDERAYRNYISQLRDVPRYYREQQANMAAGLARGFTSPAVTMQGRESGVAVVAEAKDPTATSFYGPFREMPGSIPAAVQAELRTAGAAAIREAVIPAHQGLLTFLRGTYFPGLRKPLDAYSLPDGKAYYASKIREFTTTDLTADQIHAIGVREVAKIRAQMLGVMAETGFKGDLPAFLKFLRTDPQFYPKTPEALLERAAWISKRFDGKAARWFGRIPRSRFGIIPVPPEIAPFYTAGRGGSAYLLNTYDLPSRPFFQLTALTLHESDPGHHFQGALAAEQTGLPAFRAKSYISAFGEGWALYCETLGVEMGMYETPYDRFGMLSYQMWRAARLVVDTGIHAQGWSRNQALDFMRDNTALSEREITTEIDRYIGWPGQALSYYLGQLAIIEARAKAEKALGPKFDIRAFHDTVLALGSVPLPVMTARIDRFIAEGGKGPYPLK